MNQAISLPAANAFAKTLQIRAVAPARVNLIGEHTDYTGGFVMPMAIPFVTVATLSPAEDNFTFTTDTFTSTRVLSEKDRSTMASDWSDYPVGVLRQLQTLGIELAPFKLHFHGDIPLGAGLSSSASVEVATAVALLAQAGQSMSGEEIARLCQRAENEYVQSPCGIMDQFAVTNCHADHALMLNTRDLTYDLLPMNRGGLARCVVVIANSNIRHSVATGDYGRRRKELEAGQAILRATYTHLRDLGDATLEQLAGCEKLMTTESYRRCRHVISENDRVRQAADAMRRGDPRTLGEIMKLSHISERDDFECSIAEIDFLVEIASGLSGCYGARLTGGGFGGCTVNLVETDQVKVFSEQLRTAYHDRFQRNPDIYICEAVDGVIARGVTMLKQETSSC